MTHYLRMLYIGDIMGRPGREVLGALLPGMINELKPDLIIAQAENVTHGKGMSPAHMRELQELGVQIFTGGNHTIERPAIKPLLQDPDEPVLAPINQPDVEPAWGAKVFSTKYGNVQVISLLGTIFPNITTPMQNPLHAIDEVLAKTPGPFVARIVNFHADWSSEKRVIGYYLDGKVSAVIGDHWHVPTADAMVLPKGTAHVTDVGMVGTLHSSLGVSVDTIIARWHDGAANKNDMAEAGPYQFNAVLIEIDPHDGSAHSIQPVQKIIDTISG
jgi:2',3'-cyclic-nucleotide 2'-phosphodiesterase